MTLLLIELSIQLLFNPLNTYTSLSVKYSIHILFLYAIVSISSIVCVFFVSLKTT